MVFWLKTCPYRQLHLLTQNTGIKETTPAASLTKIFSRPWGFWWCTSSLAIFPSNFATRKKRLYAQEVFKIFSYDSRLWELQESRDTVQILHMYVSYRTTKTQYKYSSYMWATTVTVQIFLLHVSFKTTVIQYKYSRYMWNHNNVEWYSYHNLYYNTATTVKLFQIYLKLQKCGVKKFYIYSYIIMQTPQSVMFLDDGKFRCFSSKMYMHHPSKTSVSNTL